MFGCSLTISVHYEFSPYGPLSLLNVRCDNKVNKTVCFSKSVANISVTDKHL